MGVTAESQHFDLVPYIEVLHRFGYNVVLQLD